MANQLRARLQRSLRRLGIEVRRAHTHPWRPPQCPDRIGTVIDVGAADGTPDLYRAYPEAAVVAIDPLCEQLDKIGGSPARGEPTRIATAVGSQDAELELHVPEGELLKASLHARTALTAEKGAASTTRVPIRRLDDLVEEHEWRTPYVLKIDTEGHDLEVLKGAPRTLADCPVVYTEASLANRFLEGYGFSDLAQHLFGAGFELVDVLDAPPARDHRVAYLDCVWCKKG